MSCKTIISFYICFLIFLISCVKDSPYKTSLSDYKGESNADEIYPRAKAGNLTLRLEAPQETILIKGVCIFTRPGDDYPYPLKFVRLTISMDNRILAETNTNEKGAFVFYEKLLPGKYKIAIDSNKFSGETDLKIEKRKHEGIVLKVQRNSD